jgi:hypothetical protein
MSWADMQSSITEFGVEVVPFDGCNFGPQIGVGVAMTVYKGVSFFFVCYHSAMCYLINVVYYFYRGRDLCH